MKLLVFALISLALKIGMATLSRYSLQFIATLPHRIFFIIVRHAIALRSWSGSHRNLSNMLDTLLRRLWSFMVNRVALRWMDSSLVISLARYGSHAMLEYFSRNRTKLKCASWRSCWGHVLRLRRRNPSVLFAFAVSSVMWFS